ncbi:FAD/NAD(P)-binding protein [Siphonobacter sp. SORGH_AS_0500]|uniref:FAD/NAD(P)-binding protein n=1 Tax=Siphonobacter sp. SORGH_AS_0500 TaxID=1864824 RepID=UPI00285ADAB1|nr:FAD/NAD(P)-binding protein [Siphonobacter sp. SORGH_AS_0500]MDR6197306.1 putative NAD(P)/FAD-binding protein YdhS [Siphonobacter sp. SORGH_AS_0500]
MSPQPRQTVAIIGAGASGVSCLIQLVFKQIIRRSSTPLSLLLFERKEEFGPGLAYGTGQEGHLLNTKAGLMGIMPGERQHFVSWMQAHRAMIEKEYPDVDIHENAYPPRMLYGSYVKDMLETYTQLAKEHGITIEKVAEEITDLDFTEDKILHLTTSGGQVFTSHYAILATGNPTPSAFQEFEKLPSFLMSPWPTSILLETIHDKTASVGIVGSSLTAIDALITLTNNGHRGPIHFFSKTGQLPRVQSPTEVGVDRKHLTLSNIRKLIREQTRTLRVKDLIRLFRKEAEEQLGYSPDWSRDERSEKDALTLLQEDIVLAREGSSVFQNILYDMREEIYDIWQLLPVDQKQLFAKWINPFFSINRHAIPLANGEKMAQLFESGQVRMIGLSEDITWDGKKFLLHQQDGSVSDVDFVINASGPATKIEQMTDQPLLQALLEKGYIQAYGAGGLVVNLQTLQVKSERKDLPLYALGQPLSGIQHEVNSLWFNVEQADLLTNHLLEHL